MIGYELHKKNKTIPTIKTITCPACHKDRLRKYANADGGVDIASEETVTVREDIRYLEACRFCVTRYRKADDKFVMENMAKLSKAFRETQDEDNQSDHKDFSLN